MHTSEIPYAEALKDNSAFDFKPESFLGTSHMIVINHMRNLASRFLNKIIVRYECKISNEIPKYTDFYLKNKDKSLFIELKHMVKYSERSIADEISGMTGFNSDEFWYIITNPELDFPKILRLVNNVDDRIKILKLNPIEMIDETLTFFNSK